MSYVHSRNNTLQFSILFSNRVQGIDKSNEEFLRSLYEPLVKCVDQLINKSLF